MALKTVTVQGRTYALGRRPPKSSDRYFLSGHGVLGSIVPTPPRTIGIPASCANGLAQTFMNTQLGCCVISHHAHFLANITSQIGKPFIYADKQIIADYSAVGGYIPGDPLSDQGCDIQTDLDYLQSTGFADGSKLLGSIHLDPTNQTAIQQAIWLTNGVCFGISMPDAWINPAPQQSGFVWDVAGNHDDSNGHCFTGFAYPSSQGVTIATWGMIGTITWAAIAKYGAASSNGEVHTYVNPEMVASGLTAPINGLTLNQICTYFNALGGTIPVPDPTPSPTPIPVTTYYTMSSPGGGAVLFTPVSIPPPPVGAQTITFPAPVSQVTITGE